MVMNYTGDSVDFLKDKSVSINPYSDAKFVLEFLEDGTLIHTDEFGVSVLK